MRTYNKDTMYSFKFRDVVAREFKVTRCYQKGVKLNTDIFYCEFTTSSNILVLPESVINRRQLTGIRGDTGIIKKGNYFDHEGREITFTNIHQVYNGVGYGELVYL